MLGRFKDSDVINWRDASMHHLGILSREVVSSANWWRITVYPVNKLSMDSNPERWRQILSWKFLKSLSRSCLFRFQNQRKASSRHRENLLRAKNSRISRTYHSEQIEQNEETSCYCSDFNELVKSKSLLPMKWKNVWLKILTYIEILEKNPRKMISKLFKIVHNSIIFGRRAYFCFEKNKLNNSWGKFPQSQKSIFC